MSVPRIGYISVNDTDGHDKVWGFIYVADKPVEFDLSRWSMYGHEFYGKPIYVFWGKRGKVPSVKQHVYNDDFTSLRASKIRKGYRTITEAEFLKSCPDFMNDVDTKLTYCMLAGDKYSKVT